MTPITALGSRYGIQGALGRSVKRAAAGGGWWDLNGTITSCVAAYQPKGAASYAASKVNLTGNTDHDAVDGTAYPDWDSTNGWKADSSKSQYLVTDITMGCSATNQSSIVRFSNIPASGVNILFGSETPSKRYALLPYSFGSIITHCYDKTVLAGIGKTAGILSMAGNNLYYNGSDIADILYGSSQISDVLYICGGNNNGSLADKMTGYIQAIAFYNAALTATQIGNLTTAMAAL